MSHSLVISCSFEISYVSRTSNKANCFSNFIEVSRYSESKIGKNIKYSDMSLYFFYGSSFPSSQTSGQMKSDIDVFVINKVREMREKAGISQADLSTELNFNEGFVGHVEDPARRDKYNLKHINALAKIFKCSPRDFLPEVPL